MLRTPIARRGKQVATTGFKPALLGEHEVMTRYVLEARSLEHHCQCCGEYATTVFCEGCDPHEEAPAKS